MKVAIIGAGNSGLLSLKNGIDENLDIICYEMTDRVGGLWSPHKPEFGISTAYEHLITNSSKEMMAFSDLPFPAACPSYLTRDMVYQYILTYCEKFKLYDKIKLRHKVHSVKMADDHDMTGCWNVTVEDLTSDKGPVTIRYDGVIIGTGINAYPTIPKIPGIDKFKGKIIHSHAYTNSKDYKPDEKIIVLGNASSGLDMATDLALSRKALHKANKTNGHNAQNGHAQNGASSSARIPNPVYVSARSGVSVFKRNYTSPVDMIWSLFLAALLALLPKFMFAAVELRIMKKKATPCQNYGIPEFYDVTASVISDDMYPCLVDGSIVHLPGIVKFKENSVVLSDGQEMQADTVLMGTGYDIRVPIVTTDIINHDNWNLYKLVWPTHLKKNTLALVGFVRINGQVPPVTELQARWATTVFSGKTKLPSREKMIADTPVFKNDDRLSKRIHVNVTGYCSEIAGYIGCHPRALFFTSPIRCLKSFFGPAFPFIYRQVGPGNSPDGWRNAATARSRIHPGKEMLE